MFYSVDILRTSSPEAASQIAMRKQLQGGAGGARIYQSFATKGR